MIGPFLSTQNLERLWFRFDRGWNLEQNLGGKRDLRKIVRHIQKNLDIVPSVKNDISEYDGGIE